MVPRHRRGDAAEEVESVVPISQHLAEQLHTACPHLGFVVLVPEGRPDDLVVVAWSGVAIADLSPIDRETGSDGVVARWWGDASTGPLGWGRWSLSRLGSADPQDTTLPLGVAAIGVLGEASGADRAAIQDMLDDLGEALEATVAREVRELIAYRKVAQRRVHRWRRDRTPRKSLPPVARVADPTVAVEALENRRLAPVGPVGSTSVYVSDAGSQRLAGLAGQRGPASSQSAGSVRLPVRPVYLLVPHNQEDRWRRWVVRLTEARLEEEVELRFLARREGPGGRSSSGGPLGPEAEADALLSSSELLWPVLSRGKVDQHPLPADRPVLVRVDDEDGTHISVFPVEGRAESPGRAGARNALRAALRLATDQLESSERELVRGVVLPREDGAALV